MPWLTVMSENNNKAVPLLDKAVTSYYNNGNLLPLY